MKRKEISLALLLAVLQISAIVAVGCVGGSDAIVQAEPQATPTPEYGVVVTGGATSPVTVTLSELHSLAQARKDVYYCEACERSGDLTPYYGPLAMHALAKAGLPHGNFSLKVSAANGLSITYARDQVENSIIALKKNQTELTGSPENGIVFLYAGGDSLEWVPLPSRIEIVQAKP
jgi:hypothetical protein